MLRRRQQDSSAVGDAHTDARMARIRVVAPPIRTGAPGSGSVHHEPRCPATSREEVSLRIRSVAAALVTSLIAAPALAPDAPPPPPAQLPSLPDGFTAPGAPTPAPAPAPAPAEAPAPVYVAPAPTPAPFVTYGPAYGAPPAVAYAAPETGRDTAAP